jgi:Protein of unknown function, DUF488
MRPDSGWRSPAFAAYSGYMSTPAFRGALAELESRARAGEALAIMCAETVWWRCHRRLIADALTLDGFTVEHLIDRVPGRRHQLFGQVQRIGETQFRPSSGSSRPSSAWRPAPRRRPDGRPHVPLRWADREMVLPAWPFMSGAS